MQYVSDQEKGLLGRQFSLGKRQYSVVDVRNINGEMMVYASPENGQMRAAFRMEDLSEHLTESPAH